ncbi:MAG TPA: hypothetical protein EYN86_04215 [Planctomycetes bacterium]|jgi:hypothetical protein|nr:hypothetical protein [Planctomycetota bacterium]
MAARRRAAAKASGGTTGRRKGKGAKPAKNKKKKALKVKKDKVIKPGPPVEVVLCIVTGLMLIVALVLIDYSNGSQFGEGMLFADHYQG